jgi:hypothetical protein
VEQSPHVNPQPLDRSLPSPIHDRHTARSRLALLGLAALLCLHPATRADWPEFRGPTGDGHATATGGEPGLPLEWSETRNVRWKTAIPHRGWSAPVVLGDQIWVTTATEDGHEYFAIGLDAATGAIRFHERVFQTDHPEPLGNGASMNSYATPSSLIEPGRVYVHFGSAGPPASIPPPAPSSGNATTCPVATTADLRRHSFPTKTCSS